MMWLLSGTPEEPQEYDVMESYRANELYSAVESLRDAIRTDDEHAH